jgi:hypothetical protein
VNGQLQATSQLFFPEDLVAEIFASHPDYAEFGQPDTTLATDTVVGGESDWSPYLVEYERMTDGTMLAWKTVAVDTSCTAAGGGMGMGGGQPPGG